MTKIPPSFQNTGPSFSHVTLKQVTSSLELSFLVICVRHCVWWFAYCLVGSVKQINEIEITPIL